MGKKTIHLCQPRTALAEFALTILQFEPKWIGLSGSTQIYVDNGLHSDASGVLLYRFIVNADLIPRRQCEGMPSRKKAWAALSFFQTRDRALP
jgi:hypothetical protein